MTGFKLKEMHTWKLSLKCSSAPVCIQPKQTFPGNCGNNRAWSPSSHKTVYTWSSSDGDSEIHFLKNLLPQCFKGSASPLQYLKCWPESCGWALWLCRNLGLIGFPFAFLWLHFPGAGRPRQGPVWTGPWANLPQPGLALRGPVTLAQEPRKASAPPVCSTAHTSASIWKLDKGTEG